MAFRAHHKQPARRNHGSLVLGMLGLDPGAHLIRMHGRVSSNRLHHQHLDIAAQLNIRAATGHVGGNGHGIQLACVGHNLGLHLMLPGVQHIMHHTLFLQHIRQSLGFLDRGGADQHRLALGVRLFDDLDDALKLFARSTEHGVMLILAADGPVGRNFDDTQLVNLHELVSFGACRAGHTRQSLI